MHETLTTFRYELLALFSWLILVFFCPGLKSDDAKKVCAHKLPDQKLAQNESKVSKNVFYAHCVRP